METRTFETGLAPKIKVENIGGSLRVRGHEAERVEIHSGPRGNLRVEANKGELIIGCDVECLIEVPLNATLDAQVVGGDASFRGTSGDVSVRTVGGSLSLRSVGAATAETVGGNVTARQLAGTLSVDRAGGSAIIDQVQADVRLLSLGGDARLSRVVGEVHVNAGGDARASLSPRGNSKNVVNAGGDLNCTIAEEASVHLTLIAGGDLRLAVPVDAIDIPGGVELRLGEGEAELNLVCGGDLFLSSGADTEAVAAVDLGEAIAARVGAEIEAHMYEIEEGLTGLGDRLQSFDADRIGLKIRNSIEKAQRRAAKAQRRAARQRRTATTIKAIDFGLPSKNGPSEEDRMMILRMLEERKISVEEAETLLGALES